MNILFFTQISPFPINGGERIRSYGLLKALSELGYAITAVIGNEDTVDLDDFALKNVEYVTVESVKLSSIERLTGSYFFRPATKTYKILKNLVEQKEFALAFLDYAFIGQYIGLFKKKNIPVIYGTHNAESALHLQQPYNGILKEIRKLKFYTFAYLHEKIFFRKADLLICVSEEDRDYHSRFLDRKKIKVIPNFLDETRYRPSTVKEDYFVMTANFGAYMNRMGLQWLIDEVWNPELDETTKLVLVGKKSKEVYEELGIANLYEHISATGSVKDIFPYISKAKALLVPLLHGSGSRLKCLEAMALKTPIISTSKGAEGIKANGFIIANTKEEFRKAILGHEFAATNSVTLYNSFIENYSLQTNKSSIEKLIKQVLS